MNTNKNAPASEPDTPDSFISAQPLPVPIEPRVQKAKKDNKIQIIPQYHDISTAVMMSTFLPGGGQLYNGQTIKGVLLIVLTFAGFFGVVWIPTRVTLFLSGTGELALWLGGIFDAAIIARRLRRGQVVSAWKWF